MLLELFHFAVAAINSFTIYYDQYYTNIPYPPKFVKDYPFKGRIVFLTFWCLTIQTVYFALALLNDFIGTNAAAPKKTPIIRKLKDIHFSIALPTAMIVATAFWGLYSIDKGFVFSKEVDQAVPVWVNHVLHTFIVVNMGLEMFLSNITYPKRKLGLSITIIHKIIYVVWFFRIFFVTGVWAYPIFDLFTWPQLVGFIAFNFGVTAVYYILGEKLNSALSPGSKGKVKGN